MDESKSKNDAALTIRRLMIWTAGVALSLSVITSLDELRVNAFNRVYPNHPQVSGLGIADYVTATVYGTCFTLFLIAFQTKKFWSSPGKILLMIFALICIFDWGLSAFASGMIVQYVSVGQVQSSPESQEAILLAKSSVPFVTANGLVFGRYFQNLAGEIGYLVGILVFLFVLFRSREKSKLWKFVWLGLLCFAVLMAMEFHGIRGKFFNLSPQYAFFYFPVLTGIPVVAMSIAFCNDLVRKHEIDWWTTLACILLPIAWLAANIPHLFFK